MKEKEKPKNKVKRKEPKKSGLFEMIKKCLKMVRFG